MYYCISLAAILLVIFGFLHFSRNRPERDMLAAHFHVHYFLAGMLLAFFFPGDLSKAITGDLGPILMFCITWAGMYFGFHLETRSTREPIPRVSALIHLAAPLIFFLVFILAGAIHSAVVRKALSRTDAIFIVAAFSSLSLYARHFMDEEGSRSVLNSIASDIPPFRNIPAILFFTVGGGLLYASSQIMVLDMRISGPFVFVFAHLIVGTLLGMITSLLIKGANKRNAHGILLVGCCALSGGIADLLLLSPLLVGVITSAFTVNATLKRYELLTAVTTMNTYIEKILAIALGVLMTVVIQFNDLNFVYIAAGASGITVLRFIIASVYAALTSNKVHGANKGLIFFWAGLAGQGTLATAAAVEYRLRMPHTPAVFAVLVLSLYLSQISVQFIAMKLAWQRGE